MILFFAVLLGTLHHYRAEIKVLDLKLRNAPVKSAKVHCETATTIGTKHLTLGFYIVSADRSQWEELVKKLPRIKHDILVTANEAKMRSWIAQRDFGKIKASLLETVNRHTGRPVKTVYLESFFYD